MMAPTAALDFTTKDKQAAELNAQLALSASSGTPRQAVFGDSTAIMLNYGVGAVFRQSKDAVPLGGPAKPGCGLVPGFEIVHLNEAPHLMKEDCDWENRWPMFLDKNKVDIATIMFGPWDARAHRVPGTSNWLYPGDQKFDTAFRNAFLAASDLLAARGAAVVWLTSIPVGDGTNPEKDFWEQYQHPEWQKHLNDIMLDAEKERPKTVRVVDLAKWYASAPRNDLVKRPDGTHFEAAAAAEIGREWLNRAIIDAYQSLKKQATSPTANSNAKGGKPSN
jgi:hypothetical protein